MKNLRKNFDIQRKSQTIENNQQYETNNKTKLLFKKPWEKIEIEFAHFLTYY